VNFCMTLSVPEKKFQIGISLFKINYGKIFVFRALDWLSNTSDWQGMAKKTIINY